MLKQVQHDLKCDIRHICEYLKRIYCIDILCPGLAKTDPGFFYIGISLPALWRFSIIRKTSVSARLIPAM
jgi:hypothetical protein